MGSGIQASEVKLAIRQLVQANHFSWKELIIEDEAPAPFRQPKLVIIQPTVSSISYLVV